MPSNAQDVAEFLLKKHRVKPELWPDIINASTLAKYTSLDLNAGFNSDELKFLLTQFCDLVQRPLNKFPLVTTLKELQHELPMTTNWLKKVAVLHHKMENSSE